MASSWPWDEEIPVTQDDPEAAALERRRARLEVNLNMDFSNTARMLGNLRRALKHEHFTDHGAELIVRDYYNELLDRAGRDDGDED